MACYKVVGANTWNIAAANGADDTAGTAWSVTATADPGISAGDLVLGISGINTDGFTYNAQTLSASGVTVVGTTTEQHDGGTTQGNDLGLCFTEHPIISGTSSGAPVYSMTANSSGTNSPEGTTVFFRLRLTATASPSTIYDSTLYDSTIY